MSEPELFDEDGAIRDLAALRFLQYRTGLGDTRPNDNVPHVQSDDKVDPAPAPAPARHSADTKTKAKAPKADAE